MAMRTVSGEILEHEAERVGERRQARLRQRRRLAGTLETTLQPRYSARGGQLRWPRIPHDNRDAAAEPLREIIALLRDPAIAIPDQIFRRIVELTTHPAAPLYGQYTTQARFRAFALAAELRVRAHSLAA
jgi:hypothetical protein